MHRAALWEQSVYFEASQSSSCDILLFLDVKCIKREPAYIDVVNQYCWIEGTNVVVSSVPFKTFIYLFIFNHILTSFVLKRNSMPSQNGVLLLCSF